MNRTKKKSSRRGGGIGSWNLLSPSSSSPTMNSPPTYLISKSDMDQINHFITSLVRDSRSMHDRHIELFHDTVQFISEIRGSIESVNNTPSNVLSVGIDRGSERYVNCNCAKPSSSLIVKIDALIKKLQEGIKNKHPSLKDYTLLTKDEKSPKKIIVKRNQELEMESGRL